MDEGKQRKWGRYEEPQRRLACPTVMITRETKRGSSSLLLQGGILRADGLSRVVAVPCRLLVLEALAPTPRRPPLTSPRCLQLAPAARPRRALRPALASPRPLRPLPAARRPPSLPSRTRSVSAAHHPPPPPPPPAPTRRPCCPLSTSSSRPPRPWTTRRPRTTPSPGHHPLRRAPPRASTRRPLLPLLPPKALRSPPQPPPAHRLAARRLNDRPRPSLPHHRRSLRRPRRRRPRPAMSRWPSTASRSSAKTAREPKRPACRSGPRT